ncbi:Nn.00g080000.m01.CDS01 [Neocucurbitaria sp. VM-36]
MANTHPSNVLSAFESLPPEIMNQVLRELLGAPNLPKGVLDRSKKWPLKLRYVPGFATSMLRTNKGLNAISKSYLDLSNKWIVFDIDNIHLLLPWANITVPLLTVDPDADYAIPEGIMRVRVTLCAYGSRAMNVSSHIPASVPERQLALVQLEHFEKFLEQIRIMELVNGVRVMPGEEFPDANDAQITATQGFHGLNIRVQVNPDYAPHLMKPLLERFRMFHGPLNEVSIVGSSEPQQARSIETSIALPRSDGELTMDEVLMHVVKMIKVANNFAYDGLSMEALETYILIRQMPYQSAISDRTPWSGWRTINWSRNAFELLLVSTATFNSLLEHMEPIFITEYRNADAALYNQRVYDMAALMNHSLVTDEMEGWILLLIGLDFIFRTKVAGLSEDNPYNIALIRRGMLFIDMTVGYFEHLPDRDTIFFRTALQMCVTLRACDIESDKQLLIDAVHNCAAMFGDLVRKEGRIVKWRVHKSMIPQELIDRGILNHMTNCKVLPPDSMHSLLLVNAYDVEDEEENEDEENKENKEDEEYGDWYFI